MISKYQMFKSATKLWTTLFDEATEFASQLGEGRVINITHSCDGGVAVVVVWFWDKPEVNYRIG